MTSAASAWIGGVALVTDAEDPVVRNEEQHDGGDQRHQELTVDVRTQMHRSRASVILMPPQNPWKVEPSWMPGLHELDLEAVHEHVGHHPPGGLWPTCRVDCR